MSQMNRQALGTLIEERLRAEMPIARWAEPGRIPCIVIDDLLPIEVGKVVFDAFPPPEAMMPKQSLREGKFVAAQMDSYDPILEAIVYAFQQPSVVELTSAITGLSSLLPDEHLYAGGISTMVKDGFLTPHLDNSHDKDRRHYRVLNLLYYVTPDWQEAWGGNLELWDDGVKGRPRTIWSKFNRLVIMATNRRAYHSVSPIRHDGARCCVSNYYFSPVSPEAAHYFHVTSFRAWPDHPLRDLILRSDAALRNALRAVFPKGVRPNPHVYKR